MTSCSSPQSKNFSRIKCIFQCPRRKLHGSNRKTLDNGLTIPVTNSEERGFMPRSSLEQVASMIRQPTPAWPIIWNICFSRAPNFGTLDYEKEQPLLDQIVELYEQRSGETNESKRSEIYEEINRIYWGGWACYSEWNGPGLQQYGRKGD